MGLFLPGAEDVPEVTHLTAPDETSSKLIRVAIKPVKSVLLIEYLDKLGGILVQAIFHHDIIEERVRLSLYRRARRDLSADLHLQTVVEETLGKLKGVVGMHRSCRISGIVDTHAEIEGLQGGACDMVDLALQE